MARDWTINGRFLTQRTTGVQRYGREIVSAIDALISENHPLTEGLRVRLLIPGSYSGELPSFRSIQIHRVGWLKGHLWEQVELAAHARGGLLSLCNTGPLGRLKQIVCIHDLNPLLFPASYSRSFRLGYSLLLPTLGRLVARVATVSAFSAQVLVDHRMTGGCAPIVAYNGHEHVNRWHPHEAHPSTTIPNTILVLGSLARHKNVSLVLDLAPRLAVHGIEIAVVGARDRRVFSEAGAVSETQAGVRWLGRLTDDELADTMQSALCLAFPSLMEGFGLPPLEAMALGCPVVVSNRASLPEVCGDAALYASPTAPDDWLSCFVALRTDPQLRQDLIARGRARAAEFSWTQAASVYLDALAQLDGVPSRGKCVAIAPIRESFARR
jgi:glycosyltransferase involved in cell wall biosynthesis